MNAVGALLWMVAVYYVPGFWTVVVGGAWMLLALAKMNEFCYAP